MSNADEREKEGDYGKRGRLEKEKGGGRRYRLWPHSERGFREGERCPLEVRAFL